MVSVGTIVISQSLSLIRMSWTPSIEEYYTVGLAVAQSYFDLNVILIRLKLLGHMCSSIVTWPYVLRPWLSG